MDADRCLQFDVMTDSPLQAPMEVGRGVMNMAYSRVRILMSTIVFFWLLYYIEMAIRSGRFARDGGEESIYRDDAAMYVVLTWA